MSEGRVVAGSGQVSCELGQEILVLHTASGTYYSLDGVSARVWKLIERPRTVGEIRDALLEEYEVDAGQCEAEVRELIERLAGEGLVEVASSESQPEGTPPEEP